MAEDLNATATPGYGFAPAGQTGLVGSAGRGTAFLYPHHSPDVAQELIDTARALVYPRGVGIYATDETPDGIEARLHAAAGEEGKEKAWTEEEKRERRKKWRACLYESLPTGKCLLYG